MNPASAPGSLGSQKLENAESADLFRPLANSLINVDGQLMESSQARVSIFDRSYLYGDSLYEVARTYDGRFYRLDDHLERLHQSSVLAHMVLGQDLRTYRQEIERTFQEWRARGENRKLEAYCRIVVSRGVGRIGFGLSNLLTPTLYTIIVQPLEPPTDEQYRKGLKLRVVDRLRNDPRALDPAMKSGNYLNSVLAYLEAARDGCDDALMCNSEGHLTEGTTFNLFYVRRGIIVTPPLDIGILDGITRRQVIQLARGLGHRVREARFPRERLHEADEVFLSSSIKEVFPITEVDRHKIGSGAPGPHTNELQRAFRELILSETRSAA